MQIAIGYCRVSTKEQGKSGLGLEAQQFMIREFAEKEGYLLADMFIEIESGKKDDRPVLMEALKVCKRRKALLLIAHLDRLARRVSFIARLIESRVTFKVVSHPQASKPMLQMMSVFYEMQLDYISERTREGLFAAKLKGIELGNFGHILARYNRMRADCFAQIMRPVIKCMQSGGITTIKGISDELNRMKVPTYQNDNSRWHETTVKRLLIRMGDYKRTT